MRHLLTDKINEFAEVDATLFATPTKVIFQDMLNFYEEKKV